MLDLLFYYGRWWCCTILDNHATRCHQIKGLLWSIFRMLQATNHDENHFHMLCYQCCCPMFHFDSGSMQSKWRSYWMVSNEAIYLYLHPFWTGDDDLLSVWFHIHKGLTFLMSAFIYHIECELYGRIYFSGMHCFQ